MIYPNNFEQKIGFDQVRELIRKACISPMGEQFVDKIRFSASREIIEKMLCQAEEFKQILLFGKSFPNSNYFDLRDELARLKTPGSFIEQEALFDLRSSLITIQSILDFFNKNEKGTYPELEKLVEQVYLPVELIKKADRIIDDKGEIKSNASEKLAEIRKKLETKQRQVIKETKRAFELAKKSGWVPENAEMTLRNGRSVIPLHAADKRAIGGIIHDESSTGQTVFVEPSGSFEINNEIRELENEERREIIRILQQFTDELRPFIFDLTGCYRLLGLLDFIRAKAAFAISIGSEKPKLSNETELDLKKAIHPLLLIAHRAAKKEVVPLNLSLDKENRILVISGPNAGGKSVCLKTTGLLQYMLQCGLHVPASPDSIFSIFENLFIDIGDEQSLENDLSTYSSHLLNMKFFLNHATAKTLFLIDEFGTGTEPALGGAIAEATLEQMNRKLAFGVITTHYTNLKLLAQKTSGLQNAAMLFDSEQMQPLFQLSVGNPGSSFAFEIARKIGFPDKVLKNAATKTGGKHVTFEQQLQQLESDKLTMDKKQQEVQAADEFLSEMINKYTDLFEELEKNKKEIIREAKEKALAVISNSNKLVENTIREIKEAKADKEITRELRQELETAKEVLENEVAEPKKKKAKKPKKIKVQTIELEEEIKIPEVGDFVRIKDTDIVGELVSLTGDTAVLNVNQVRLKTSFSKLIYSPSAPKKETRQSYKSSHSGIMAEINKKVSDFNLTLDLRGQRGEEALHLLKKYIDDAILLSMGEVSILHGKGYGILRNLIREYLGSVTEIKSFKDAPLDQGGSGITRVNFK